MGRDRAKKKPTKGQKKRGRGAPPKNPADRLDIPKTIKFTEELERRLRAMAREEKGSKAFNSLIRRVCEEAVEEWMDDKGYSEKDISKLLGD